jgi:pyridoxine kinase
MKPIKKVALLHSLCSYGKASITNMMPILATMGVEVCPIPTMILSTHTGGYQMPAIQKIDAQHIRACAKHYLEQQISFDCIFVGYLGDIELVDAILDFINAFPNAPVILDPIMGDHGVLYSNLNDSYTSAFRRLLGKTTVLLPNITEAALLTDTPYKESYTLMEIKEICMKLHEYGSTSTVITSVEIDSKKGHVVLYQDNYMDCLQLSYAPFEFHGTGDVFDAVLLGAYLSGISLEASIQKAHDFVYHCLLESSKHLYDKREGLLLEPNLSMLV